MTNEEKARKIAEYLNQPNGSDSLLECHQAAMLMAKWKDEQYAKSFAPILIEIDELKHQVKSLLP